MITCLYSKLEGSIVGGRPCRWGRYITSLHGLLAIKADFVCFTSAQELPLLEREFAKYANIRFIEQDITQSQYSAELRALQNPEAQRKCDRCQDLQQMKFSWHSLLNLEKQSKVYWIDVGLSSQDLMAQPQNEVWPLLAEKLEKFPNKLLAIGKENEKFLQAQWPRLHFRKVSKYQIIGGFFGGPKELFIQQCERMQRYIREQLDAKSCAQEETMMNVDYSNHADEYHMLHFDIWQTNDCKAKSNVCFLDMMRLFVGLQPLLLQP